MVFRQPPFGRGDNLSNLAACRRTWPAFRTRQAFRPRGSSRTPVASFDTVGVRIRSSLARLSASKATSSPAAPCRRLSTCGEPCGRLASRRSSTPWRASPSRSGRSPAVKARTGKASHCGRRQGQRADQPKLRHAIPCCCPASRRASRGRPLTAPRRTWATIQEPAASGLHVPLHGIVGLQVSLFLLRTGQLRIGHRDKCPNESPRPKHILPLWAM